MIGPYCIIGPNVAIGENSWLQHHVTLCGPMRAGARNKFYAYCSIGQQTQDLKYAGEPTYLEIGDENTFREFVTVNRSTTSDGKTQIGSRGNFLAYSHIGHDCQVGNEVVFSNNGTLAGHVQVGDNAVMGGLTAVHQFCRIGRFAITGGCSKIVQDVPPFMIADGNPAEIRGINQVGLERKNFSPEKIKLIKEAFRLIYRSKLNTAQAIEAIRQELPQDEEIAQIVEFIETSDRGIIRRGPGLGRRRDRRRRRRGNNLPLHLSQERRGRRVRHNMSVFRKKIESAFRLFLLHPAIRFFQHRPQNIVTLAVAAMSAVENNSSPRAKLPSLISSRPRSSIIGPLRERMANCRSCARYSAAATDAFFTAKS